MRICLCMRRARVWTDAGAFAGATEDQEVGYAGGAQGLVGRTCTYDLANGVQAAAGCWRCAHPGPLCHVLLHPSRM